VPLIVVTSGIPDVGAMESSSVKMKLAFCCGATPLVYPIGGTVVIGKVLVPVHHRTAPVTVGGTHVCILTKKSQKSPGFVTIIRVGVKARLTSSSPPNATCCGEE
jgi:hypothetical protein